MISPGDRSSFWKRVLAARWNKTQKVVIGLAIAVFWLSFIFAPWQVHRQGNQSRAVTKFGPVFSAPEMAGATDFQLMLGAMVAEWVWLAITAAVLLYVFRTRAQPLNSKAARGRILKGVAIASAVVICTILLLFIWEKASVQAERRNAENGDALAQYNLGSRYHSQDRVQAAKWWRASAEQGNASAQFFLGQCYRDRTGVPQNNIEAYKWYSLAAAQGAEYADIAASCRDAIALTMSREDLAEAQRRAAEFRSMKKAASKLGESGFQ